MALTGKNISLPIFHRVNDLQTSFHGLVLNKFTVDSVVMSLGDKITGDVYYIDSNLECSMQEYVVFNDVEYTLVNPPTLVKEGMVSDNSDLKGMCKYSFEFYHPMYLLGNLPFTDVAVSYDELRYKSQDKTFSWIGKPADFVAKLNKNLDSTEWVVVLSDRFPADKDDELSEVLSFDNNTIADALKTGYETWGVPFVVDKLYQGEYYHTDANNNNVDYYTQGKRFVIVFGLPSNEIYEAENDDTPFVFRFGQGVGLKNHSRTPRNNKIVTRIAGLGSEDNIPYGYPQVVWLGNQDWEYTINNAIGMQEITVNGETITAMSYPIYKGIVGGKWVKLIKHPFTRTHLMPTIYADSVFNKVSQYTLDENDNVIDNPNYNPDLEIKDYYDAVDGDDGYNYVNLINPVAPSYEIHEFEDIKPELGEAYILGATPINADLTDADSWDDTMDDNGNYLQSYFKITLPQLSFDIYACAAITQEMQINMHSGACIGCTFTVQVDWEDYKRNFYDSELNFLPDGSQRDLDKYPNSKNGSITVVVQKDNNTFGTLMPNIYQNPHAGDAFVVLGISLPLEYITSAQERLDDAMKSYMLENNLYYFDYPLKFDEYFLANKTYILNQIRPNSIIRFMFNNEAKELFVKQLTIKFNENTLPQYDITLTDNVEVVLNSIGQVADDVEHLGTLIALLRQQYNRNVWVELNKKLSRANDDTAQGLISFVQGWETFGFFSNNLIGTGAKVDGDGNGEFESLNVRGSLRAAELVFNLISAEEGEAIRSIGHGEIESVVINPSNQNRGTITLKLDGDEWASVSAGDICRGLYNTIGKDIDNSTSEYDTEDANGFRNNRGFFASYFRILSVTTNTKGSCTFTYQLQVRGKSASQYSYSNDTATTEHPCPLMKFAVYGNTDSNKKNRQSCVYTTAVGIAPRELYLAGVNDWKIKPENIKIAKGNIQGLHAWEEVTATEYNDYDGTEGVDKKYWDEVIDEGLSTETTVRHYAVLRELVGDAGFYCEDNIYLGGIINQFKSAAMDAIESQLSNLGQAYVGLYGNSSYIIDCDKDGYPLYNDIHIWVSASLYYGNELCTLDTRLSKSHIDGFGSSSGVFSDNDTMISREIVIDGSTLTSPLYSTLINVVLTGTLNGVEYTSTKTIPVTINRQGEDGNQGSDGIGAVYVSTDEDYFVLEADSDGNAIENTNIALSAKLMVGATPVSLDTTNQSCSFGYGSVSYSPSSFEDDGNVTNAVALRTFTIRSGHAPSSNVITINLSGSGYQATKKVNIIVQKQGETGGQGETGPAGNGISSVITYYLLTTMYEGVQVSDFDGNTTYSQPTAETPYLWRYTHYAYTNGTSYDTTPELIYVYSDRPNPNLLDDTEFLGESNMTAWYAKGEPVNVTSQTSPRISYSSVVSLGHNSFGVTLGQSTNGYLKFLYQSLYDESAGIYKIAQQTWYTLSFWVYSGNGYSQSDHYLDFEMSGVYDSNSARYLDGNEYTGSGAAIHFQPTNEWVRHTVTFKTPSELVSPISLKFQMYARSYNQNIRMCMPKLEVGRMATEYVAVAAVTTPMARTSTWESGKQYYKGATGEPYMDIVVKDRNWYRCLRSHISTSSNAPVLDTETAYWSPANNFDFVATDLLLADQAVINLMFSQKILMQNDDGNLTASINADGNGSYCIYYPESGRKMFEFSFSKNIICYNDDDSGSVAWRLGKDGEIEVPTSPRWSFIYLNGPRSTNNNSFSGNDHFRMTKYPQYLAGDTGISAKDKKIYKANHSLTDGNGNINTDNDYIADGWYTSDSEPMMVISIDGDEVWQIELVHIVSGSITERLNITSTVSGS